MPELKSFTFDNRLIILNCVLHFSYSLVKLHKWNIPTRKFTAAETFDCVSPFLSYLIIFPCWEWNSSLWTIHTFSTWPLCKWEELGVRGCWVTDTSVSVSTETSCTFTAVLGAFSRSAHCVGVTAVPPGEAGVLLWRVTWWEEQSKRSAGNKRKVLEF